MFTLSTFYRSKEWQRFRQNLINERTDENGQIICAHCGKPILKRYDCIGHHKTELTEENVNDALVALNPDNVELIHFGCHNSLHQRSEGFKQSVYLVYGSPCSGKSTYVESVANPDDLILDIDRIWDAICFGGRYTKLNNGKRSHRLKRNVFNIRDCIIEQIRTRSGMWRNAFIIGGYPLRTDRDRLCDMLRAIPIYVEATQEECIERARRERPEEWQKFIVDWFDSYVE